MGPPIIILIFATLACICDIRAMKIPNALSISLWVTAFFLHAVSGDPKAIVSFFIGSAIPFFIFFIPFRFKMIGAGDVKLLMAIGGSILYPRIISFILSFLVFASILSIAIMLRSGILKARFIYFFKYLSYCLKEGRAVPYRRIGNHPENLHLSIPILMSTWLLVGGLI